MRWLSQFFHRSKQDAQLDSELRFHVEQQTADYIAAGMNPDEARRRALAQFGGLEYIKEETRDARGTQFIDTLLQDIRFALRMLRKSPGFTATAILTLAIGIGANTAIFSIVNSVLLRPLAYRQSQQLCLIREIVPQISKFYPTLPANLPNFRVWQKEAHSFEQIAIVDADGTSMDFTDHGPAQQIPGTSASANLFDTLGVRVALGRDFRPEEDQSGHDHVVILTNSFWRSEFHSDPSIVGKTMTLDGIPCTIVGVLPASFHFPQGSQLGPLTSFPDHLDFFKPLGLDPNKFDSLGEFDYAAIGRLKPGVTISQALAELNVIQAQIAKRAKEGVDLRAELIPLDAQVVGSARQGLLFLLAAVGAVLLIVCVNLANLLLARVPGRMREAAVRTALGATRLRLIRQMLTESLLLGIGGGALGIALASFGVRAIVHAAPPGIPRLDEVAIDPRVLWFAIAISILTAALFGILPAWRVAHAEPQEALKSGSVTISENRRTRSLRSTFVGAEVALSTVLLIVAGLLTTSLVRLLNVNAGFQVQNVLATDIQLPPQNYKSPLERMHFYDKAVERARAIPGVVSAAWVSRLPFEGQDNVSDIFLPPQANRRQHGSREFSRYQPRLSTNDEYPAHRGA